MARSYSARLSLWNDLTPGLGSRMAAASTVSSRVVASMVSSSPSGRGMPGGGIIPARSLRMIFSAVSACAAAAVTSNSSSERLPRSVTSLWQVTQLS